MEITDSERLHWCVKHKILPVRSNYIGIDLNGQKYTPTRYPWVIGTVNPIRGKTIENVIDLAMQQELMEILRDEQCDIEQT